MLVMGFITLSGCPTGPVPDPSPGGVEGLWSTGADVDSEPENNRTFSQEQTYYFSGTLATLEYIFSITAGAREASIVVAVTSSFDVVDTDTGPALSFTAPVPSRTPTDAELQEMVSVQIAGFTAAERSAEEERLEEGQTLEDKLIEELRFSVNLLAGVLSLNINCLGSSCSALPFILDGDTLTLSGSAGELVLMQVN